MNNTLRFFLGVLNDSIHGRITNEQMSGEYSWQDIVEYMNKTSVGPIIYDNLVVTVENGEQSEDSQKVLEAWRPYVQMTVIRQMRQKFALKRIQKEAEKQNIILVHFKGVILADLYSNFALRSSCDSDIFTYPEDKERSIALLTSLGYEMQEEGSNEQVPVYYNRELEHKVELHFCLWEDYEGAQMRILEGFGLTDREKLIQLTVCKDLKVWSMDHTSHLIFQIFHIVKHFVVEGIGLRYVTDISLFVEKYKQEIDWKDFWKKMHKIGYEKFAATLFALGIRYFELDPSVLCGEKVPAAEEIDEVLKDMMICGEIVERKSAGWQLLGIMTPYLEGEEMISESKWKQRLKVMFPASKALSEDYSYAKKRKIFVPVAWIHRGINFLKKRARSKEDWYSASEKMELAEHRLELLKKQDLVKKKK